MAFIYLGLGTNLGDRMANLRSAQDALADFCRIIDRSRIYETAPVGLLEQPSFLNMALKAETALAPIPLLTALKTLEKELGRVDGVRWGPRLIDIDILLYDGMHFIDPILEVPHPRLTERRFALAPLADVGASEIHPVFCKTIAQLLDALPEDNGVKILSETGCG